MRSLDFHNLLQISKVIMLRYAFSFCLGSLLPYLVSLLLLVVSILPSFTIIAIRQFPTDSQLHRRTTQRRRMERRARSDAPDRRWMHADASVSHVTNPDDHLVKSLPLLEPGTFPTSHWAGLLPASPNGTKYFFYWLFAPDDTNSSIHDEQQIPLLIWLNGGPACSSMNGLWLANGPFRLVHGNTTTTNTNTNTNTTWTIDINPYSWHTAPAYVLYVDQPVGTGLSFTTNDQYPTNDLEINRDFYYFLEQFLWLHADKFLDEAERTLKRPFYFSGESYAGHYIPTMMAYIQQQNERNEDGDDGDHVRIQMPLSGAAIGNGWVDPLHQFSPHEAAYLMGIIGRSQMYALDELDKSCQEQILQGRYDADVCYESMDYIIYNSYGQGSEYIVSQYDIRRRERVDTDRQFPPGHKILETYLGGWAKPPNEPKMHHSYRKVLAAIHALPSEAVGQYYQECTDPPYDALVHQDGLGVAEEVKSLLNTGIPLLFYNGILDLVCNHIGNEIFLEELDWKYQNKYKAAQRYGWKSTSTGRLAGYMKHYENLFFLKMLDSGHVVPLDLPEESLEMIQSLMFSLSFDSYEQSIANGQNPKECPLCASVRPSQEPESKQCPKCDECHSPKLPSGDDDKPNIHPHRKWTSGDDPAKTAGNVANASPGIILVAGFVLLVAAAAAAANCIIRNRERSRAALDTPSYMDTMELPPLKTYQDVPFDYDKNLLHE